MFSFAAREADDLCSLNIYRRLSTHRLSSLSVFCLWIFGRAHHVSESCVLFCNVSDVP